MLEDESDLTSADVYILPPDNSTGSDEDSGDEDSGCVDNLTKRQLEAEAEVTIHTGCGDNARRFGTTDSEEANSMTSLNEEGSTPTGIVNSVIYEKQLVDQTELGVSSSRRNRRPSLRVRESEDAANVVARNKGTKRVMATTSRDDSSYVDKARSAIGTSNENHTVIASEQNISSTKRVRKPSRRVLETYTTLGEKRKDCTKTSSTSITDRTVASLNVDLERGTHQPPVKLARGKQKPVRKWVSKDLVLSRNDPDPPNIYANVDSTPASLFERFLDDHVVDMLVEATNLYAKQKGNHTFTTSPDEFRLFVAVLFTSGYNPLPRRKLYWENTDDVVNIAVCKAMTRNRFDELMKYLHVANNDSLPAEDRFAKIRPMFSALNERFLSSYPQHQLQLSIDESMVPYYGRHSAKQFIRGKPIRFGYKVWSINTPAGYCIQVEPYQGKGVTDPNLGLGGSVVMGLAEKLPGGHHQLYFDNFFTSLRLIEALSAKNIGATGTIRANRVEDCPLTSVDKMKKTKRGTKIQFFQTCFLSSLTILSGLSHVGCHD